LTAITALSLERDFQTASPPQGRDRARRLVLLTTDGAIRLTTAFMAFGNAEAV